MGSGFLSKPTPKQAVPLYGGGTKSRSPPPPLLTPYAGRPLDRWRTHGGPAGTPRTKPQEEGAWRRSEEHTSELQSRLHLVCRLLLEKKKQTSNVRFESLLMTVPSERPCDIAPS